MNVLAKLLAKIRTGQIFPLVQRGVAQITSLGQIVQHVHEEENQEQSLRTLEDNPCMA